MILSIRRRFDEKPGKATTAGTEVIDRETGASLVDGIYSLTLSFIPGDVIRAQAGLYIGEVDVDAEAVFVIRDPRSGENRRIKAIEFADGERWEP